MFKCHEIDYRGKTLTGLSCVHRIVKLALQKNLLGLLKIVYLSLPGMIVNDLNVLYKTSHLNNSQIVISYQRDVLWNVAFIL